MDFISYLISLIGTSFNFSVIGSLIPSSLIKIFLYSSVLLLVLFLELISSINCGLFFELHFVIPNSLHFSNKSILLIFKISICSVMDIVILLSVLFSFNFILNSINFSSTALSINALILSV